MRLSCREFRGVRRRWKEALGWLDELNHRYGWSRQFVGLSR